MLFSKIIRRWFPIQMNVTIDRIFSGRSVEWICCLYGLRSPPLCHDLIQNLCDRASSSFSASIKSLSLLLLDQFSWYYNPFCRPKHIFQSKSLHLITAQPYWFVFAFSRDQYREACEHSTDASHFGLMAVFFMVAIATIKQRCNLLISK